MTDPRLMIARGRRVLATEAEAVAALEHRLFCTPPKPSTATSA